MREPRPLSLPLADTGPCAPGVRTAEPRPL